MSPRALRIGVDARSLLCREPRGEGKSLLRLYTEMLAQQPALEVVMFGDPLASNFTGQLPAGARAVSGALPGDRWSTWENVLLPWLAWRHGVDVLHAASSGAPWFSPVPVVMTVHDLIPVVFADGHDQRLRMQFQRRLGNGLRQARRVITVSAHTRKDLLAWAPDLRVPVDVIPWGADDRRHQPTTPSAGPDAPPQAPYLLAFGGEAHRKNTDFTLECFAAAAQRVPDLQLVMVGINARWQQERVAARLAALGLTPRVRLPGFVHERALDGLVRQAVAVLYPSLYEGFGLPLLEAIGAGTPVVASDRTSIPEVLAGAPGALPLDIPVFADALCRLATDPAHRRQWAEQQAQVLTRFDWKETARRTLECLATAAGRRS